MNKEPITLYILRFILSFALFAFMAMLYWSSVLVEQNIRDVHEDVKELKREVEELRFERKFSTAASPQANPTPAQTTAMPTDISQSPNLLQKDPFYAVTLPKLLGPNFKPRGTFHFDTLGKPAHLHPFSNWANVSSWIGQCSVSVSRLEFGKFETNAPDAALRMEQRTPPTAEYSEYWVQLRPGIFWQPLSRNMFSEDIQLAPYFLQKHPVTAHDFKFFIDAMFNPYNQELGAVSLRTFYGDLHSIEVIDDLNFVVRWKTQEVEENGQKIYKAKYIAKDLTGGLKPLASFLYQRFADGTKIIDDDSDPNTYRTNSVWAQNFSQHWSKSIIPSCGPWIFVDMTDRQITFKRNPDHYSPLDALVEKSEYEFKDATDAVWQDFKSNKIDIYNLQPDQVVELERFLNSDAYQKQVQAGNAIKRLDYLARQYTYIGWNQAKPFFKSTKVRQALTMAIDRQRIIRDILNGMGEEITGTFFKNSPSYDTSLQPWPYDVQKALRNLNEEGWYDDDGDGVLDKVVDGKRVSFRFNMTYYVKNTVAKAVCEYVATALKDVGIICNPKGVDIADLSAEFDDKSFDAITLGWALGAPPENPRQLWYSSGAKEKGSSNAVGFANAEADKIINALDFEFNKEKRIALYHQFNRIIFEEQPYTFLYTPKTALLYREHVQNVFIPADRQDLIPGANIAEPESSIYWLKK